MNKLVSTLLAAGLLLTSFSAAPVSAPAAAREQYRTQSGVVLDVPAGYLEADAELLLVDDAIARLQARSGLGLDVSELLVRYRPLPYGGRFYSDSGRPVVELTSEATVSQRRNGLVHELAHAQVAARFPHAAPGANEGYAYWVAGSSLDAGSQTDLLCAEVGRFNFTFKGPPQLEEYLLSRLPYALAEKTGGVAASQELAAQLLAVAWTPVQWQGVVRTSCKALAAFREQATFTAAETGEASQ